jgi:hypothetical protein
MTDLPVLERFQQGVVSAERPYDPTLREGPVRYYDIGEMLSRGDVSFLVAESQARVIGCGFAQIERPVSTSTRATQPRSRRTRRLGFPSWRSKCGCR